MRFFNRHWYLVWIINGMLAGGLLLLYQYLIKGGEVRAETLQSETVFLEESRKLLKKREELLAAWQPYQYRLDHFFFTKDRLVPWLEFLEGQARLHHLGFEVSSLDENDPHASPLLRVMLRGTLFDTIAFLHAVETGPYGIQIKEGTMRIGSLSDLPGQAGERITQLTFLLHEASR